MSEWIFLMSLTGSLLFLTWGVLCQLIGNRFSARWQYTGLKVSLFFFLAPVGPCLKALLAAETPTDSFVPSLADHTNEGLSVLLEAEPQLVAVAPVQLAIPATTVQILILLWILGTAVILVYKGAVFLRFRWRLQHAGQAAPPPCTQLLLLACQQKLRVLGTVRVMVSPAAPTPFVMGLLRPVIVLPDQPFSHQELRYILLHELTHLKRGDLWIRWASMLAMALHWWNPLVHLLDRKVISLSEESCDEQIVIHLSNQDRYHYGQVLLKVICSTVVPEDLAAQLSTTKSIQRRLSKMLRVKTQSKWQKVFSLCIVLLLLVFGTVTALAVRSPITSQEIPASVDGAQSDTELSLSQDSLSTTLVDGAVIERPALSSEDEETAQLEANDNKSSQVSPNSTPAQPDKVQLSQGKVPMPDASTNDSSGKKVIAVVSEEEHVLYTEYDDGSRINSPYYQQQLEQVLDEANQKGILINGQYPRNSSGETYGPADIGIYGLVAAVGEPPALMAAVGTKGELGYIRSRDECSVPCNLPTDQCPHTFMIPLYDSEGTVIGEFAMSCGGHMSVTGKTPDTVKAEIAGEAAD